MLLPAQLALPDQNGSLSQQSREREYQRAPRALDSATMNRDDDAGGGRCRCGRI